MEVELVHWPADADRLSSLRLARHPRLLLVAPGEVAPVTPGPDEDWIRLPADERDLQARVQALSQWPSTIPTLDEDGLLRNGEQWTALPPIEARLTRILLARLGKVVSRDVLLRHGWPEETPTRNVLDVHMLRLRRRLEPLGLSIRTVRKRGYVLSR